MKAGSASAWLWAVGIGLVSGCHSLDEKSSSDFPQASGTEANFSGDRAGSNHNASNGGSSDLAEEAVREPATEADPNAVVTNPFVTTETDPFSTFAADVDTASYDIYRRSVLGGVLPTPSEVRVEQFVNYFTYAYAAPSLDAATRGHPGRDAHDSLRGKPRVSGRRVRQHGCAQQAPARA
jgi:Ca-activated chloride channel family protein